MVAVSGTLPTTLPAVTHASFSARASPASRTAPIIRPDPNFVGQVLVRENLGQTDYDALMMQIEKRFSQNDSTRVSYTLSYSRRNTSGNGIPQSSFPLLTDPRLELYQDTNAGPDQNGILFGPLPSGECSGIGSDAYTATSEGGRDGAYGPGSFQIDLRFGYRLRAGGAKTVDIFGEILNLVNLANLDSPAGDRRSRNFLILTALRVGAVTRTGQIGVRFAP